MLAPLPPVLNASFVLGVPEDPWPRWLASLNMRLRASGINLAGLKPLPTFGGFAVTIGGSLAQRWAEYLRSVDTLVRRSGWSLVGLKPLPPVTTWPIADGQNRLSQPWAEYLQSLDRIVRANT